MVRDIVYIAVHNGLLCMHPPAFRGKFNHLAKLLPVDVAHVPEWRGHRQAQVPWVYPTELLCAPFATPIPIHMCLSRVDIAYANYAESG